MGRGGVVGRGGRIQARGSNLTQNAIVGVFLRVLEYYPGILFLTTNRCDSIDDAILSRCTARITYGAPSANDQKKIWRILANENEIDIPPITLDAIVEKFPMSGREIKNVLKLRNKIKGLHGDELSVELVEQIKDFRPTTLS